MGENMTKTSITEQLDDIEQFQAQLDRRVSNLEYVAVVLTVSILGIVAVLFT